MGATDVGFMGGINRGMTVRRRSVFIQQAQALTAAGRLSAEFAFRPPKPRGMTAVVKPLPRLKLQGFNNLTKALSFNIYDVCYAVSKDERQRYIEYLDEEYNADRLTQILTDVAEIIDANILKIDPTDYAHDGQPGNILNHR